MTNLIIYRCCDRPKYVEQTFPHLIKNTSDDAVILMADNSSTQEAQDAHWAVFEGWADQDHLYNHFGSRIGVWHIVYEALAWYVELYGKPEYVMIADDDCLVPSEGHPWDIMLSSMLDSGLWDVVGCAENGDPCTPHPRDLMEDPPPFPEGRHKIRGYELKGEGLARGRRRDFVGGACSAMTYSWYDQLTDLPESLSTFWFNINTHKFAGEQGRCAHFAGYPIMTFSHLDLIDGISLADSDYPEYSDWMHHYSKGQTQPREKNG